MKIFMPLIMVMVCACFLTVVALPSWAAAPQKVSPPNAVAPARSLSEPSNLSIKPSITITSPKNGEIWYVGKTYTVTWEKQGKMDAMANIGIWSTGYYFNVPYLNIKGPNSGTATITVPQKKDFDNHPSGLNCKVQVSDAASTYLTMSELS